MEGIVTKHIESTVPLALRLEGALRREVERLQEKVNGEEGSTHLAIVRLQLEVVSLCLRTGLEQAGITE